MAINFPTSPSVNDIHTSGDMSWKWDGTTWKATITTSIPIPSQSGQAGEFLQTDGTTMTWEAVTHPTGLPSQTGQAGEFLTTDGTNASWEPAGGGYDIATTSTGYFDLPAGTTAQRPGTPASGNFRHNTTDDVLEWYTGSTFGWRQFAGANPTITGINPTTAHTTGTTITVTGINFQSGSIVKLIGNDSTVYTAASTSFVDSTEVTFTTPELPVANEPYDVKLILPAGGFFILANALDAGGVPVWTTAAGSLGDIGHSVTGTHFTLVAVDPDGQTVTYSADTANTAILTTAGLTLNSDGTITGDPTNQASGASTTYTFDVTATDGVNSTTRSFSITVRYEFFEGASGGTITTYTDGGVNYKVHTFTIAGTTQTFNSGIGGICDILAVAGGGGGGRVHNDQDTSQGGGGAGCVGIATNLVIAAGNQTIDIGRGAYYDQTDRWWKDYQNGNPGGDAARVGLSGEDTVLSGIITLPGGGGGGRSDGSGGTPPAGNNGVAGGSGGGSGSRTSTCNGGASNKPTVSGWTTYGNSGGGANNNQTENGGGGGGGAGGTGGVGLTGNSNAETGKGGDGGIGIQNDFQTGVNQYYGGGGAGGSCVQSGYQALGGLGGGGKGNCQANASPDPAWTNDMVATENTGGGGGGSSDPIGGSNGHWAGGGGSGIVIIRYVV